MTTTSVHSMTQVNMDKQHENYMQCDLSHAYFQLVQTLFFIEINPNTTQILQTKQAYNEMINFNFISAENPNNKIFAFFAADIISFTYRVVFIENMRKKKLHVM